MNAPPVSADLIQRLLAHRERDKLDFKECDYDWTDKDRSRNELAKDLIAMANRLSKGDEPSYILLGVRENADHTGAIVGMRTPHLEDAAIHQKVSGVGLNRVPSFVYALVQIAGLKVGVYQILPGGRPYYFMNGNRKFQALQRCGSATEPASPDEIYQWALADDPVSQELRAAKLDDARGRIEVKGEIETGSIMQAGREREQTVRVRNHGQLPLTLKRAVAVYAFGEAFYKDAVQRGINKDWRAARHEQLIPLPNNTLVPPQGISDPLVARLSQLETRTAFASDVRIVLGNDEDKDWRAYLECTIEIEAEGAGGRTQKLTRTFRWI